MNRPGDNIASIRRSNRSAVLRLMREQGGVSRKMLAERMELTPAAMTKIVGGLLEENLLREGTTLRSSKGAGRSQVLLEINPDAYTGLGIMINVGDAILSAVRLNGQVLFAEHVRLPERVPAADAVRLLGDRLMALTEQHHLARERLLGIGLAMRGAVDLEKHTVRDSFGALLERNVPLAEMFEQRTGLPTLLNNNVRALFSAQRFLQRGPQDGSELFVRCEYGIGASLSVRGEIWDGANGRCSEIGHIPVIRRGGKPCLCGKCGCLETVASPWAILRDAMETASPKKAPLLWKKKQEMGENMDLDAVMDCARNGDPGAARIVDRAVHALASSLRGAVYILDPGRVVLYGRLFENEYYLSRLMTELREGLDRDHENIVIEKDPRNPDLEPMAGGVMIIERFFDNGGFPPEQGAAEKKECAS